MIPISPSIKKRYYHGVQSSLLNYPQKIIIHHPQTVLYPVNNYDSTHKNKDLISLNHNSLPNHQQTHHKSSQTHYKSSKAQQFLHRNITSELKYKNKQSLRIPHYPNAYIDNKNTVSPFKVKKLFKQKQNQNQKNKDLSQSQSQSNCKYWVLYALLILIMLALLAMVGFYLWGHLHAQQMVTSSSSITQENTKVIAQKSIVLKQQQSTFIVLPCRIKYLQVKSKGDNLNYKVNTDKEADCPQQQNNSDLVKNQIQSVLPNVVRSAESATKQTNNKNNANDFISLAFSKFEQTDHTNYNYVHHMKLRQHSYHDQSRTM